MPSAIGVATIAGVTVFTGMPDSASSLPSVLVSETMPAFDAA